MTMVARRVLFVAHSPHRGGAEYCLDTTLRHLDRSRFEPLVAFPFDGPLVDSTRQLGIETIVTPMCHWLYFEKNFWYWRNFAGRSWLNVRRLTRLIREHSIELVYTNTSAIFESAVAAKRAGVPHVWHIHEVLRPGNEMSQLLPICWLQRFIRKYSDQVVFESHAAKAVFEQTTPIRNAAVVYNSLRLDSHPGTLEQAERVGKQFGIADQQITVLYVGQFIDRKNPLLLIDSMARLPSGITVQCLLVGEGPLEAAMHDRITQLGLTKRCRIIPFQSDISPLLEMCDLLVLPSREESFGLVLLEAAAFGKPVIACRCQGPCEIVVDGETGLLIEQNDPCELAQAISSLAGDPELSRQMGAAGRRRINNLFSPRLNTRRLETLLEELLDRDAPREPSSGQLCQASR